MKIKICGLTTFDSIRSSVQSGADYIGFVFYAPSPRDVSAQKAIALSRHIPQNIKTVAVIVDAGDEQIDSILRYFTPDIFQCHGKESVERVKAIKNNYGIPVIKAISVRSSDDVARASAFTSVADMLLFDAKVPNMDMPGGNGIAFDWSLLRMHECEIPWFLSGGLNIENVNEALQITGAKSVDVSSSLEIEPGKKDPELIKKFIEKVRQYE